MPEEIVQQEVPAQELVAVPAGSADGAEKPVKAVADSETAANPEAEKPAETSETSEKRGKWALERKLSRARKEAAEHKARAELLDRMYQELKQPKEAADTGAPKLENFSDIEEYATAKAEYAKAQALKQHEAKQQTEAQKREAERLRADWEEKAARGSEKYDDFDEVVGDLQPTHPFSVAIMEAENAEDIAHFLGKNPKEAQRIAALPPRAIFREIGKLEAKLLAEPPKPKTPSKAPAPIAPLGGKSGASNDSPSDSDDVATWIRKENERMKRSASA